MDNYIGSLYNVPDNYGVDIPDYLKKYIMSFISLPTTGYSTTEYYIIEDIEFYNNKMYFVVNDNQVGNLEYYVQLGEELEFIDPDSAFILHSARTVPYAYTHIKSVGYYSSPVSENTGNIELTYPPLFKSSNSADRYGVFAVDYNEVKLRTSNQVMPIIPIRIRTKLRLGSNTNETTTTQLACYNVFTLIGLYNGIIGTYRPATTNLGISENLGNIFIYNFNGGTYPFIPYLVSEYYGYTIHPYISYGINSNFSSSRHSEWSSEVNLNVYYSLFNKIVFADSAIRIDNLLSMPPDEFQREIKHNYVYDPYRGNNPSGPDGGNGNYGKGEIYFPTVDKIPDGTKEVNDSSSSMYTRYVVDMTDMAKIGDWFWTDDLGLAVAKTVISLFYGNPVDTVISCVSYPFSVSSVAGTVGGTFYWGGDNSNISASILARNAISINWGTITVNEYWGNFLDYSPHTTMQLYLPWGTGFVSIDPNDIINAKADSTAPGVGFGTLGIITNIDLSKGVCVHNVIANNTVIGSYSGSCGRNIPITGSDYASKQVALAGAAIGAITAGGIVAGEAYRQYSALEAVASPTGRYVGGASDGILRRQDASGRYHDMRTGRFTTAPTQQRYDVRHGQIDRGSLTRLAANASRPAIASAAAIAVHPPSVTRSGSFQEGTGGLGIQEPYLIISRPKMSMPTGYGNLYGYPSNIYLSLGSISGYTEVGSIHLDGIPATAEEISEIDSLLKGGVIL